MSRFIILCLMLASLSATTQKRLTSYITEGEVGRVFFKEVDGVNYAINITTDDVVKVSKIVNNGDPILLSSRSYFGIGKNLKMSIFGSKLAIPANIGIDVIDFLTHESNGMWIVSGQLVKGEIAVLGSESGCVIKGSFSGNTKTTYFYIGDDYVSEVLPDNFEPTYLKDNFLFGRRIINNSSREYYIWNIKTNKLDILVDPTSKFFGIDISEDKAWYLDNGNEIFYYDLFTFKRKATGIKSNLDKLYKQVLVKGDEAIIYQGTADSIFLEKFNLTTKAKLSTLKFPIKGGMDTKNFHWRNDHLLYRTLSGELGAIDIVNGTKMSIKASSEYHFIDYPIVDDRYIIAQEDKVVKYLDIKTGEIITSVPSSISLKSSSPGIIKVNGQIWTSFVRSNALENSIFMTDTQLKTINVFESSNVVKSGLHENSRFVNYNGGVVVSSQNMYQLNGENITELNDAPVNVHKYRHSQVVLGDRLFYHSLSNDSLHLHQVRNGVDSLMLSIPEPYDINMFGVTNKYFYYFDLDSKFFQIDLKTHEQRRLVQYENPLALINSIISYEHSLYIRGIHLVHKLNDNGTIEYFLDLENEIDGYFIEGNTNYFVSNTSIHKCTSDSLVPLALNLPSELSHQNIPDSDDLMFTANQGRQLVHVNKDKVTSFAYDTINPNNRLNIVNLGKNFAIISDKYGEVYILDYTQSQFVNIGDHPLLKDKNMASVFIMHGDTLVLVRERSIVHTYQATNNFNDFTLRHSVDFGFETTVFEISTLNDFGLLQTQYSMYYISKTGELIKLPDLISSVASRYATSKNESHIYFFGINTAYGSQVYSLSKDALSTIADEEKMDKKITLYPNPSQYQISIKGLETHTLYDIQIYNANGQIIKQGLMDPSGIDISDMLSGTYFVKIKGLDRVIFLPFVKF